MSLSLVLQTDRMRLIPLRIDHCDWIHQLHLLPEIAQYNTIGIPKNREATRAVLAKRLDAKSPDHLGWILLNSADQFLGEMGMQLAPQRFQKAEISYSIHPRFWNQGFATEAVKKIIQWGFEVLPLHRIEAGVAVTNTASIRVLEKAGMVREGRHRKILPLASGWTDNYSYAVLDENLSAEKERLS